LSRRRYPAAGCPALTRDARVHTRSALPGISRALAARGNRA